MTSSKFVPLRLVLCIQILLIAAAYGSERFCGPKLTEILQILCRNRYASLSYNRNEKRSDGVEDDNAYIDDEQSTYPTYPQFAYQSYPFVRHFGSTSAFGPRVRRDWTAVKRGVYDDCCLKPCSIPELMNYCGV